MAVSKLRGQGITLIFLVSAALLLSDHPVRADEKPVCGLVLQVHGPSVQRIAWGEEAPPPEWEASSVRIVSLVSPLRRFSITLPPVSSLTDARVRRL